MNILNGGKPRFRVATLVQAASTFATVATIDSKCRYALITLRAVQTSGTLSKANWSIDTGVAALSFVHDAPGAVGADSPLTATATNPNKDYWKDRRVLPGAIIQGKNDPVTSSITYIVEILEYY